MEQEDFNQWTKQLSTDFVKLSPSQKCQTIETIFNSLQGDELLYMWCKCNNIFQKDFIHLFPLEIIEYIFEFLDTQTLLNCCCVSKKWNNVVSNLHRIWKIQSKRLGLKAENNDSKADAKTSCKIASTFMHEMQANTIFKMDRLEDEGHLPQVLRFNEPDRLASGSSEGGVVLWNLSTKNVMFKVKTPSVTDILFDDDFLFTASYDCCIYYWKWKTSQCIMKLRGHTGAIYTLSWDRKANVLFSGAADKNVRVWNAADGRLLKAMNGHKDWVMKSIMKRCSVDSLFHSRGDIVVMSADRMNIIIWSLEIGVDITCILSPPSNMQFMIDLGFDGDKIYCSISNSVLIWDFKTLQIIRCVLKHPERGMCFGIGKTFLWNISKQVIKIDQILPADKFLHEKSCVSKLGFSNSVDIHSSAHVTTLPALNFFLGRLGKNVVLCNEKWLDGFSTDQPKGIIFAASVGEFSNVIELISVDKTVRHYTDSKSV